MGRCRRGVQPDDKSYDRNVARSEIWFPDDYSGRFSPLEMAVKRALVSLLRPLRVYSD